VVALALRHDVQVFMLRPQSVAPAQKNSPTLLSTLSTAVKLLSRCCKSPFTAQVAGDDFKSGQTKIKSVLVDYLVSAGIKVSSIVSYNHLGNNDGKNLSAPEQFRSKEISKSNVVDDMVLSNGLLYSPLRTPSLRNFSSVCRYAKDEHPDHVVVIKSLPHPFPH
jgi:hypothetical protein